MKSFIFVTIEKITTYKQTERKPTMLETPQKTPQNATFEGKTPQKTPQNFEPKKSKLKRKFYQVIQQVKGVTLVARPTAKQRVSYQLVIYKDGDRLRKTLFAANERDAQAKAKAIEIFKETADKLAKGIVNEQTISVEREDFFVFVEQLTSLRKPVTQKAWRSALRHMRIWNNGRPLPFKELSKAKCFAFKTYLQSLIDRGELRRNTANLYLSVFKTAVKQAAKFDLLQFNPADVLESFESEPTRQNALTIAEFQKLFATPEPKMRGYDSFALKTYILFLARTGLRPTDSRAMRWSDIHELEGVYCLRFVPNKTRAKNPTVQTLPLHDDVVKVLLELKRRIPNFDPDRPIFEMLPRKESDSITRWLRKWCAAANIQKHVSLYSLRHSYATQLVEMKVPIYEVSKLMTHVNVRHTQRYARILEEAKIDAVRSLPSVLN